MAELILLKCDIGSKAAIVLCPECGRISRQILAASYFPNRVAELIRPHTCPVCETVYRNCNASQTENWSAAFAQYNRNADAYNQSVKENFVQKAASRTISASQPVIPSAPAASQQPERYWFCGVTFNNMSSEYYYISDIGRIDIGTQVVVPFGSSNATKVGIIKSCRSLLTQESPYPMDKTKHIIRKATETDMRIAETVSPLFKNSEAGYTPSVSTSQQFAEKKAGEVKNEPAAVKTVPAQTISIEEEIQPAVIPYSLSTETPRKSPSITKTSTSTQEEAQPTPDENLDKKIEYWKRELLDTGKRNKMINFRETKRATLRILEPEADELFNRLAFSDKPLTFQKPISKDTDLRTYSMIALMETLSYTLNVQIGDIKAAGTIIEREKTLKNLRSKAKLAQEEQGTNILYLCFGFIYWREHNRESSPWFKAPLLMMPVTLGLKSLSAPYTLSRYDDEIEVNPTLDYLFNTEYHIDLPAFELKNRQSIEEYFSQIETIVDKRGWKVVRDVSLGLLSFLKISMYHDLDNNREMMVNHPVLRAMAGDRHTIGELPIRTGSFDFDSIKPDECYEVVDSDSSQEEAIILSKSGVSFVMQGPPGTGKSQTITNIIAEALANGKKVLFVAEKAAALQVVLKRLTEVGLDDFCLSLHNYKANKKEIIDSIGANLNLQDEYIDSSALRELTELFHDRAFLNAYAGELHKPIAPLGQSIYMVFGRLSKLEKSSVLEFSVDNPTEISKDQYAVILYCVSAFEKALHNMDEKLSENPWFGTKAASSGQTYKMQLLRDTEGLSDNLREIASLAASVDEQLGIGHIKSFSDVKKFLEVAKILEEKPAYVNSAWFDSQVAYNARELLGKAKSHSERLHNIWKQVLQDWKDTVADLDVDSLRTYFCGDYSWIYNVGGNITIEECLSVQTAGAGSLKEQLEEILAAYHEGTEILSYPQADTTRNIRMVRQVLSLIADAPYMEDSWLDARRNAEIVPLIEQAIQHSIAIGTLTEDILKDWEPSAFDIDADGMLARFKTEYVGMFHTWKSGYKEDIKTLRLHSKAVGGKVNETTVIDFLQKVKELKTEKAWFEANVQALTATMGNLYHGEATEWSRVRESISRAIEIANKFPYSSISSETVSSLVKITASSQVTGEVRRIAEVLSEENLCRLEEEIRECRYIDGYSDDCDITRDILPQISSFIESCSVQRQYVAEYGAVKTDFILYYEDITTLLSNVAIVKEEKLWFENRREELEYLFADAYKADASDWNEISLGLAAAERLTAAFDGSVPESIIRITCGQNTIGESFQTNIMELDRLVRDTEPKIRAFFAQFSADTFEEEELGTVANRYDSCINGFDELNKWLDYTETRNECDKHGLADFTAKIAALDNTISDVQDSFERGFYIQWLNQQLDSVPAVQNFRRRSHEQRSERFVKLDAKQYEIARKRIRKRIISTYPNLNSASSAGLELAILRHEMEKKRRIMPLRKLFQSIPTLLLTLKPCLMMSPLSVAYFLDAKAYQFDMVIFDEASQIFPQDAIGAIIRARQVVIAGDTMQLPPTNFFAASTSNGSDGYDDDEGYDEDVYDSILEEAANILPNCILRWHYRSKHEHLIAFSNHEIYKNHLVTFPSSNESEPDTGVEFVYVEDGYYEPSPRNYNILEARRIVELVREHIEKHPDRSLGIIAFSEKQQQAISLEIQRFKEKHPEYEAFFTEDKDDEFFVKNLENVQGDERDTIFFSVGYARTKEQKDNGKPMSMRFGPLGVSGGERRLNVAITRAKINVKLVSSILPSDIDLSKTESAGIRMLRSYIEFAMNGETALASAHKDTRPDDFADSVADFIRSRGFEVQQYVGCSGYKIDIAVKHPSKTVEQFVAGIECDGFSYVSAKTARDRDRLRSSVLKSMGWNLYRVWSVEWYKNPEIEKHKLIAFIQNAIRVCDERIKVLEEQRQKEEEAKRAELEKARAAQEAEERRLQREQEIKEAKLCAEREEAERKRKEDAEKKAAKIKAEQEVARKREEERKMAEEQRRREKEAGRILRTFSWVKPGVHVVHNRYGAGVVQTVSKDVIKVQFGQSEKTLSYPSVFEKGIMTKPAATSELPKSKGLEWAVVGAPVVHKAFGDGVIESIDDAYMSVRFGDVVKQFLYPDAFTDGHLARGNSKPAPTEAQMSLFDYKQNGFASYLCSKGYTEASANAMVSIVSGVGNYAIEKGFTKTLVYDASSLDSVRKWWTLLEKDKEFIKLNTSQNHRFSDAMKYYLDFLSADEKTEPESEMSKETVKEKMPLLDALKTKNFKCVDNCTTSSILWVIYDPARKGEFDSIISGYNVHCKLEKRGALATNNAPAWRIMFNQSVMN